MSIDENYERKYNPHPLRNFEVFERHSLLIAASVVSA
jgi:hypothetical protein